MQTRAACSGDTAHTACLWEPAQGAWVLNDTWRRRSRPLVILKMLCGSEQPSTALSGVVGAPQSVQQAPPPDACPQPIACPDPFCGPAAQMLEVGAPVPLVLHFTLLSCCSLS